jgi:hypothetical protein
VNRWAEETAERNYATAWIVWAVAILVALILGWAFLLRPALVSRDGQTLEDSYGSQKGRVLAARQAIVAIGTTTDVGQKKALTTQACALIADINDLPPDLGEFNGKEC